ncbi:hypothetical protein ACYPKM_04540 [Pseudomonas aeruginosa]
MHESTVLNAMKRCAKEAKQHRQMSAERIADALGVSVWCLYKWLETGRMPINVISAYERACGSHYVTEALAKASQAVVVDYPDGRRPTAEEFYAFQGKLIAATGILIDLEAGSASPEEADEIVWTAIQALMWQMLNVRALADPQQRLTI